MSYLPLTLPVGVSVGGTGATSQSAARTALGLATVASTGAYGDLSGAPTLVSAFTNDAGYVTTSGARSAISATGSLSYNSSTGVISYTAPTLATVATSGSAADLTGNLAVGRFNSGTAASISTFWRGDGTWGMPTVSILNDNVTSGPVYPLFFTGTGSTGTLYQSDGGLAYFPATGGLRATVLRALSPGTGNPAAVSGEAIYAARSIATRVMPTVTEPSGRTYPLQGHLAYKNFRKWCFGAGTAATTLAATVGAFAITSTGTITIGTPSSSNPYPRSLVSTGVTAGTTAATRCATANIGAVVAGTRWHYTAMFGVNTFSASQASVNAFVGLFDVQTAVTGFDPTTSSTNGKLGIGFAGTANDWRVINNAITVGPVVTLLTSGSGRYNVNSSIKYQLDIWSDGTNYYWQVAAVVLLPDPTMFDINSGTFSANRPASGTLLYPQMVVNNGSVAAAQIMEYYHVTLETDV